MGLSNLLALLKIESEIFRKAKTEKDKEKKQRLLRYHLNLIYRANRIIDNIDVEAEAESGSVFIPKNIFS